MQIFSLLNDIIFLCYNINNNLILVSPMLKFLKTITIILCFLVGIYPWLPTKAIEQTASLFISLEKESFLDPDYLTIDLVVSPGVQPINTIKANLSFSLSKLALIQADKEQSFCSFFIEEKIDNEQGVYSLSCGAPNPENSLQMPIVRLTFKKLEAGWAKVKFLEDSSVLASDGLGTNILGDREIHNIYVIK